MSAVRQSINNAFASLGLAPAPAAAAKASATVSSQEAIALEEEYSAHKCVHSTCDCPVRAVHSVGGPLEGGKAEGEVVSPTRTRATTLTTSWDDGG